MLAYRWHKQTGTPVIFLHGLLGSKADWLPLFTELQNVAAIRPLAIDLPCHGESLNVRCQHFEQARQQLHQTLTQLIGEQPFWLVGYSLGGRLALDYSLNQHNPQRLGTILEGTNIGLGDQQERFARWQNDQHWATRFRNEPIEQVLLDWYQQAVFSHLDFAARQQLIQERKHNCGNAIAQLLEATSLAKQNDYRNANWHNIHFLIGEHDQKFRQIAEQNALPYRIIAKAGHNAHRENPVEFGRELVQITNL